MAQAFGRDDRRGGEGINRFPVIFLR
jgi:hypothetical protein